MDEDSLRIINGFSLYPECIDNLDYREIYSFEIHNFIDGLTKTQLSFEFNKNFSHDVLIYEQCGGGRNSINFIKKAKLTANLRSDILDKISRIIYREYATIHIRNTDYKTDYKVLFSYIKDKIIHETLVICTDDLKCARFAKKYFKEFNVVVLSDLPETNGKHLHMNENLDRYETNIAMFVDLFALSLSNNLYFTNVVGGHLSGFSMLANMMKDEGLSKKLFQI